jgi:pimeloyl-ACP methyl ester carboxylesterase
MKCKRRDFIGGFAAMGVVTSLRSNARAQSPNPRRILLAHGLLGFKKIGSVPYFNGVPNCFDKGCEFITPQVDPAGTIKDRAGQLEDAIRHSVPTNELKPGVGIHIVAHSMGGLDARYLISKQGLNRASWFASVTTISTPHHGSQLADIITGEQPLKLGDFKPLEILASAKYWTDFFKAFGKPLSPTDLAKMFSEAGFTQTANDLRNYLFQVFANKPAAFQELTTTSTKAFNATYQGWEGVPLRSYAGVSTPDETMSPELYGPWAILKSMAGDNDGVVPQSSSSWPNNTAQVTADHFEEVGLASYFDGSFGIRKHFQVCNLYKQIDSWQISLTPA